MATEVGTAYVSVLAKTDQAEKGIRASLDKSVREADKAGKEMGDKLSSNISKSMDKGGAKAGAMFDKGFAPKVAGSGKNAMAGLSQVMMGGAEGLGSNVGGGIMGSLVTALNRGASGAITALDDIGAKGGSAMASRLAVAGAAAAAGVALVTAAAVVAGKALYDIGDSWDAVSDGILFKTGKVGAELDSIVESVKKVGVNSFAPIAEISAVSTSLVKGLKLSGTELETLTNQIANYNSMAQENGMEPLNITEFMKAMKRFKIDGDVPAMTAMLDQMFTTSQDTTIPLNTLVGTMKQVGTQARDFKLPAAQVVQILAEFDNAGMDAQTAMTGFRTAMKGLAGEADPAGALRTQIDQIYELANSSDEAAQAKGREMAQTLFGKKAYEQFFTVIQGGKLDVENLSGVTRDSSGAINEARDQTADFGQEWTRFKNFLSVELEPVATRVFGGINDFLTKMVQGAKDFIGWLKDPSWDKLGSISNFLGAIANPGAALGNAIGGALFGNNDDNPDSGGGANRSAAGLQPQTADLQEKIAKAFPAVKDIGGFRKNDPYPDHPSGKAIDVMIPPDMVGTPMGNLLGSAISKYALQNGAAYTMWQQKQYMADGSVKGMEDRKSPTQNHMDHVHILTRDTGGVLPQGLSFIKNGTGKDELILNPEQMQMLADQGIDVNAIMNGRMPLEDEPGWDWKTQGNKRGGPGVDPNARQPLEDEPGWDWRTQGNKRGGPGVDPNATEHGTKGGAAPGPTDAELTSNRTEGFTPAAASSGGVAGTSMVSKLLNMGAEAANGAIDMAAQAATMAASAGTMGAGGAAAGAGIQIGSAMAKRGVSYGFQMAGIGADALIEQLFPFGAPRWIGYDYTAFAPGGGGQVGITTGEKATNMEQGVEGAQDPSAPMGVQAPPDPGLAAASNMGVDALQPVASPPLVNIGSINGVNPNDVGKIITDRQRLAQMQYGGRP